MTTPPTDAQSIPPGGRRRRRTFDGATPPQPGVPPATGTADTLQTQAEPAGVPTPPTVPTELLEQSDAPGSVEATPGQLELGEPMLQAQQGSAAPPAPPAAPPQEQRRRGRRPREASPPPPPNAAPTTAPPVLEPTDDELRALGQLMLMARKQGRSIPALVSEMRAMVAVFDRFGV